MTLSPRRSLLVVGNGPTARELAQALGALPYDVHVAETTADVDEMLRRAPVDVLLQDAAAPLVEATPSTSADDAAERPATIVFAADAHALKPALAAGAEDFLLPPFDPDLVQLRVEAAVGREGGEAQRAEAAKREALLKLERDLQIGRSIQQGFLPAHLPRPDGWEVTACFHPAREVAGDFYDAFYMVNRRRLGFVIADVCDKGVGAALFMSLFRTLVRSNAQQNISLGWMDAGGESTAADGDGDWLKRGPARGRQALPSIGTGALMNAVAGTNSYITENHMDQGYFATMFFGVLDPVSGALVYINGGHNPPVLQRADGSQTFLKPTGPAVGMLPGVTFKMGHAQLDPGDLLFAYTDGVTDARSPAGAFFTEKRLFDLVGHGAPSAEAMVGGVEAQLHAHIADAPQFDDITMIALRRQPVGGATSPREPGADRSRSS